MKKGEDRDTFRRKHSDYDKFLGEVARNTGGHKVQNPVQISYIVNKVPEPIKQETPSQNTLQSNQTNQLQMFTNNDIKSLGFRNYNGLINAVNNQANSNNNFIKALTTRYGADTSKWNQQSIEKDLGVKGIYRSFGSGDFGDMSRNMASWMGTYNGNLAKQEQNKIWNQNAGVKYSLNDTSVLANKYQLQKPQLNIPNYTSGNLVNLKFKNGGMIYKYQQGGQAPQQDMQQQAVALVQAAMQGDQQANQTIKQIMQAAQQGDQQALQVAQLLQQVIKQMQGSRKARLGAKLEYFKCGGKKSYKKLEQGDPITEFKKGCKVKKAACGENITKHQQGGSFKQAFDNAYGKQRYFTWNGKVYAAYKGDKATDQGFQGAIDNLQEQANALKDYNAGEHLGWNPGANKTVNVNHNIFDGNMQGVIPQITINARKLPINRNTSRNTNQRKQSSDGWTATAGQSRMAQLASQQQKANNSKYMYGATNPFENMVAQTGYGGNWHKDIQTWKDPKTGKSYQYVTRDGINYLSNGRYWNPKTKTGGNYTWKPGWRIFGGGFSLH